MLVFCGRLPEPLIVGPELLVVVGAAPGAELVELGAAPEELVEPGLEEVVEAAAELAVATHEQMALAAIRTDAAVAWQFESTQPSAADWMAAYWELEHWHAKSVRAQPTREAAEEIQGT